MVEEKEDISLQSKTDLYKSLTRELFVLLKGDNDLIANTANFVALIFHNVPDIHWAGIYFYKSGKLILGPFQGKPACPKLEVGRGLTGIAAERMKTTMLENVHEIPGQISFNAAETNSQISVPLIKEGHLIGVLDISSELLSRFDAEDKAGLENLCEVFLALLK
ncbi:conserved hypothetical protein [Chloroherpeton thalassium ATCC 35110]|uniref:GAF domain-containing protein n=1 Tax=Chloroherpeton thalassium (strain ATCC 35110 / GB-78) TaxID=517418 RepID=B3QW57_CHLT3|nr:GAF domain-containing protein [Chloroherpeton thalassium]ACF14711.1 conserved hypothetical protein [Chloroherpeton thalassium ATCC 35110]